MNIREIAHHQTKEIWDVDYLSTSDEEDNDSEAEDNEDQELDEDSPDES